MKQYFHVSSATDLKLTKMLIWVLPTTIFFLILKQCLSPNMSFPNNISPWSVERSHLVDLGKVRIVIFWSLGRDIWFSLVLMEKSVNFYLPLTGTWQHISFLHKSALFEDQNLPEYAVLCCQKNYQNFKKLFSQKRLFSNSIFKISQFSKFLS